MSMLKIRKSNNKNSIFIYCAKGVAGFSFFLLDIFAARLLGYKLFDEWGYFYSLLTIGNWLVRMGIDTSTKVYVSRNSNDQVEQNKYIKIAILIQGFVSLFWMVFVLLSAKTIVSKLNVFEKYTHLQGLITIGSVYLGLYGLACLLKEIFVGKIEFHKYFIVTACEYIGYLLFSYAGIMWKSIYGLGIGFDISIFVSVFVGFVILRKKELIIQFSEMKRIAKNILSYSFSMFLVNIGSLALAEMDTVMLGTLASGEVGKYTIAKNLILKASQIPLAFVISKMPNFVMINTLNYKKIHKEYNRCIRRYIFIVLCIVLGFITCGKYAISILYGSEYISSYDILMAIQVYFIGYCLTAFYSTFLSYRNRGKEQVMAYVIMIVINAITNYIFIPIYGAMGAVFATDFAICIFVAIMFFYSEKEFNKFE